MQMGIECFPVQFQKHGMRTSTLKVTPAMKSLACCSIRRSGWQGQRPELRSIEPMVERVIEEEPEPERAAKEK